MGLWEKMADRLRASMRSFLQIQPPMSRTYNVTGEFDWTGNALKNRLWYRGQAGELEEFWKQAPGSANRRKFWSAVPMRGRDIEKLHVGLPALMVDTLSSIVVSDLNQVDAGEGPEARVWGETAKENDFYGLLADAVSETLVVGDGAFRLAMRPQLSAYPVVEFIGGDRVELERDHGRLVEVRFLTDMGKGRTLVERYGRGYIRTELEKDGEPAELAAVPELAGVAPEVTWGGDFMMAVPLQFFPSKLWPGRGGSVFDARGDGFDALDECWSQWMDALRKGRTKEYVPESLVPRDPDTGAPIAPNAFDNAYIMAEGSMAEGVANKVEVVQPEIRHESYVQTYSNALDICMQGLVSPSTLGIDVKKLDNAEAQREKEKVTLYTRNQIVTKLQQALPQLVRACVWAWQTSQGMVPTDFDVDVEFGEYANPSFESMVETVGKAKVQGIMSVEACVEELYGDSRDAEWKAAEVERLKSEQGMAAVAEPTVGIDWADVLAATGPVTE